MTDRGLALFGALVLLSAAVLATVLFTLPGRGIEGLWQTPPAGPAGQGFDSRQGTPPDAWRAPADRPDRRMVLPRTRDRSLDAFWIRPFGLHRSGLEGLGWYATAFGILLISSFVVSFVFPGRLKVVSDALRREPRRIPWFFLLGVAGYALIGLLVAMLFLNFTTNLLLLLVAPAILLATLLGLVAVEYWVGHTVVRWSRVEGPSALTELIVGVVLLFLVSSIPYAGWAVVGIAAALGFGALLHTRFGSDEDWNLDALET